MQQGSLIKSIRKRGPDVWQFRWAERGPQGKRIYRKRVIGTVCQYSDADSARTAVTRLLTEIDSNGPRRDPFPLTVKEVCNHFEQRELNKDNIWRSRWNNDNQPHNELTWTVNWAAEAKLDR